MIFDSCNAHATFQRCMMSIFFDMVGDFLEVFMDDFSVFGSSFDDCPQVRESVETLHGDKPSFKLGEESFHGPKGDRAGQCWF